MRATTITGGEEGAPYCPVHDGRLMELKDTNGRELTPGKRAKMLAAAKAAGEELAKAGEKGLSGERILELQKVASLRFPLSEEEAVGEHDA